MAESGLHMTSALPLGKDIHLAAAKKKCSTGLEARLCLERWICLNFTSFLVKECILMSKLKRPIDLDGLVKASS